MKNLKKVFAVVITLSMVLSTVAFAAVFSDVSDNAAYAEAIELGNAIGMFTGYEDGSFKPDGDITRAEFAAIIVRMLGQEEQSSGAAGATKFADVPSTHWAAGYINIVTNLGIVNGYGDGNFGPEDNVTYEQAVKMCVVALGYEPAAGGNYPVGYLTIAQQRGVTINVKGTSGVAINRGQVAQMAFNSLDVPIMTQTGFGTYIEYVINDGTKDTVRQTLLSENLDIIKIKAMVEKTYDLTHTKKDNLVQVEVLNAYKSAYGEQGEIFFAGRKQDIDVGKTNLKSFVGYNVIAYVSYNDSYDDDPLALYVRKDIAAMDEISIAASDIESVELNGVTHFDVSYMPSKDARNAEKISVDKNARIYVNGEKKDAGTSLKFVLSNFYGVATFALNDTGSEYDYDTVYVLDYVNAVVESVNTTTGKVNVKEGKPIYFGPNQTDYSSTLYDEDGKEIEWSSLEENDILSSRKTTGDNNRTVFVCTLIRNSVEGVITEKTNEIDAEFKIGGVYYKTDRVTVQPDDLDLQYEGTFYLDIFGRIAYYEAQSSLSSNYAFVIDSIVEATGFENRLQVKAFTFDGEVITFTGATRISLVEENAENTRTVLSTCKSDGGEKEDDTFGGLLAKIPAGTVITFAVNSQGELSRIALPGHRPGEEGVNYFAKYVEGNFSYRGNDGSIRVGDRTVDISKDTVIMIADRLVKDTDFEDDDDYELLSLSVLGSEDIDENFVTKVYDVNKNGVAGLIVVAGKIDVVGTADGLAMVTNKSRIKSADGGELDKLTVFQGGASKELEVLEGKDSPDLFSLIAPSVNARGEMSKFGLIAKIVNGKVELGAGFEKTTKLDYFYGAPTAIRNNRVTLDGVRADGTAASDAFTIPSSANVYLYDDSFTSNARKAKIVDGVDVFDIDVDEDDDIVYKDDRGQNLTNVEVLIRRYDGKIQDVVVFFNTTKAAS